MTYNDVIKGLECCIKSECSKCPLKRSFCSENVAMEYALDLINRQKSEIEKKDIEIDILIQKKETLNDEVAELKAEIERFKTECFFLANERDSYKAVLDFSVVEAIKEFAERLKKYKLYYQNPHSPIYAYVVEVKAIDNLVKEMAETGGAE